MFAKIRSLLKQSAVYGIGSIAARAVAFLMLPYYTHLMTPAEYGIYALFLILIAISQPIYVHGMDIALLRFSSNKDKSAQNNLGMVLTHTLVFGGIFSLAIFIFAPEIASMIADSSGTSGTTIVRIASAIILMDALSYHIFTWLRICKRPIAFSSIKMLNVIINITLNIILVGTLRMGVTGAYYAYVGTSIVVLTSLAIISRKALSPHWKWSQIKKWLAFGLPNMPAQFFYVAIELTDRKWIEHYLGSEATGIYSAGYRVAMLMNMIAQAFRYAWQPFFLSTANDDDARETFARVLTYYVMFVGWVWLAGSFFLPLMLQLPIIAGRPLIDPEYWAGFAIIPIVMLAHIFNGLTANFMVGVYLENKTKIIPIVAGIAALVNIVGNWLLIPHFGYIASAWLTVASYVIIAFGTLAYINPRYPVPYEWDRIIRTVITVAAAWGITIPLHGTPQLIVQIAVSIAVPVIWISYVLDQEERSGLKKYLTKFGL